MNEHVKDRILSQEEIDYIVTSTIGSFEISINHVPEEKKYEIVNLRGDIYQCYEKFTIDYEDENSRNYLSRLINLINFLKIYIDSTSREHVRFEIRDKFFNIFGIDTYGENEFLVNSSSSFSNDTWLRLGRCFGYDLKLSEGLRKPKE